MVKVAMLSTLRVKDVMTEALVLLKTTHTLGEAWEAFHEGGISGAPVLDPHGRMVGVLSLSDLADPRRRAPGSTVGDAMTRVVYAVRADDPILVAILLMMKEGIHRVIVVDENAALAGIVVPMDIVRALAQGHEDAANPVNFVDLQKLQG
jgi:predicted transcriptional regulator